MSQTTAILNYFGRMHNLIPQDPLIAFNGECMSEHYWRDHFQNEILPALHSENRAEAIKEAVPKFLPGFMQKLEARLPADKKYLCGDELSIYDFSVGGYFTNIVCNPMTKDPQVWAAEWAKAPQRVQ